MGSMRKMRKMIWIRSVEEWKEYGTGWVKITLHNK